ncbi:MAG: ArsC family reductase [Betaproteobacteria bacterium]|nr:ArsC family reductase [Betaproteobacteria bacterium]
MRSESADSSVTIYGIKNCDSVKKARSWLDAHQVAYRFHDYKTAGLERDRLERWCRKLGWEMLLNRAGTTFRKLADADRQCLDAPKAIALMLAHSSLVKRPVLERGSALLVGFNPEAYERAVLRDLGRDTP